jgi:hypothetical protein
MKLLLDENVPHQLELHIVEAGNIAHEYFRHCARKGLERQVKWRTSSFDAIRWI